MQEMSDKKISLNIGGKWAISWRALSYGLPTLILLIPITEGVITSWWAFWRWTLVSFLSFIPVIFILLIADSTTFRSREKKPVPGRYVFLLGLILGIVNGFTSGILAFSLNLTNLEDKTLFSYIAIRTINSGLVAMLLLPLFSLISSSYEIYQNDRNALIADRMLHQSQKSESIAVIKSLRASMTRKVDENLLAVIKDSQEYFDEKGRSLEKNWELMSVKLRKAALDTIRPFSHQLHRAGEEKVYRVHLFELLRFVASTIRIETTWVLLGYLVLNFKYIFENSPVILALWNMSTRLFVIFLGLQFIKILKQAKLLDGLFSYMSALGVFVFIFHAFIQKTSERFQLGVDSNLTNLVDGILLFILIILVGFVSAFFYGQHAESQFLERQLSKEQLEAMLLKREEDRLSRELAKYLHGTIQSRLMASAMALEKAGRKGDKKALERELAQAYKSLRVPSASYFAAPEDSFNAEIKKVISKWNDLMKIKVKIDKTLKSIDPVKSQEIGNAVNEGLSNAFRHGNAEKVDISVSQIRGGIKVEIIDDGSGPQSGKGGLGAEWFNAIAGKNWKLHANAIRGSTLELLIPNN